MNCFDAKIVLLAQAQDTAKLEQEAETARQIQALTNAGFPEPVVLLDKLRDLTTRAPVRLTDLVQALVQLRQQPESAVVVTRADLPVLDLHVKSLQHDFIEILSVRMDIPRLLDEFLRMSSAPAKRFTNKRGQRSQQKPWHPRFRRLS